MERCARRAKLDRQRRNPFSVTQASSQVNGPRRFQFGADVFVRMLYGVNDPLFIHMGGLNVSIRTENWEVETEEIEHGNTSIQRSTICTPAGILSQDFSTTEVRPGTFVFACTKKPIATPADLEIAIRYEPRMPAHWKERVKQRVQRIRTALGNRPWIPCAWNVQSLWDRQMDLARKTGAAVGIGNGWIEYAGLAGLPPKFRGKVLAGIATL